MSETTVMPVAAALLVMPVAAALLFGIALSALKNVSSRLALPLNLILSRSSGSKVSISAGCELLSGGIATLLLSLAAMYFLYAIIGAFGAAPGAQSSKVFDEAGSFITVFGFMCVALHYAFSAVRWFFHPESRIQKPSNGAA